MSEIPGPSNEEDQVWSDASYSFYENSNLGPEFGHGRNPLTKFSFNFGNKTLKFRVANRKDLEKNYFFCKECPDIYFQTSEEQREHNNIHNHSVIRRKCSHCDVQFISNRALAVHCRFVHGETLGFKCELCSKQFTKKHYLLLHLKSHEIGDRFYCKKCGHWYKREEDLIEHEAFCDKGKRGKYPCSFCERVFVYPKELTLHERAHTGEKPYSCGICGSQFSQATSLSLHLRIHTGERRYACRFCPIKFVDVSAARRHEIRFHFTESRLRANGMDTLEDQVYELMENEQQ